MKKILLPTILFLLIAITFTGCSKKPYSFSEPIDEIESIELVSAENSLNFTVKKTLSKKEKNNFIEQFQKIQFTDYYIGDPMSVSGNAVKITYQNGNYEMVCHYWSEYVKDGVIYYRWKSCEKDEFNKLFNNFLK